jgi:hypothetical protein
MMVSIIQKRRFCMLHKKLLVSVAIIFASLLAVMPGVAQDVVADGLTNPRGMAYDSDGNLYVVETGANGDLLAEGPFGQTNAGGSGSILQIRPDGSQQVIIQNLGSMYTGAPGEDRGAQAVLVTADSIWFLMGENPLSFPLSNGLVEVDRQNFRIKTFVDLFTSEAAQNPDGDIVSSNPTDFAVAADGSIIIANAGCNCVQRWSPETGVEIYRSWTIDENPVPTTVAIGPDGDVYLSFLTGFPFSQGESRIERWRGDELLQTYTGLTAVVDVLVAGDGTIYAVEHGVFGDAGWGPGRVVTVSDAGITPVLEGLNRPWGLAQDANGGMVVSVGAALGEGAGQVIRVR